VRAVVITEPGGPGVLRLAEVSDPVPADDEVVIQVAAAGVNRADVAQRQGSYPPPPGAPPYPGPGVLGPGHRGRPGRHQLAARRRSLRAAGRRRLRRAGRRAGRGSCSVGAQERAPSSSSGMTRGIRRLRASGGNTTFITSSRASTVGRTISGT